MEQLSFFSIEKKIQNAITLLKMFEAKAIEMHPEGYYLCFSGGKDSQVIYELAKQAKVKFQAYYNVTTVDPPELVYFIRKMYPAVIINQPDTTMWELISQKHYPPTRRMRYCCSELKERGGKGRFVVTGVRWAESRKRRKRGFAEIQGPSELRYSYRIHRISPINRQDIDYNGSDAGNRQFYGTGLRSIAHQRPPGAYPCRFHHCQQAGNRISPA